MSKEVEEAFLSVTKLLFGHALTGGIDAYGPWLVSGQRPTRTVASKKSGKPVYIPPLSFHRQIDRAYVKPEEADEFGRRSLSQPEAEALTLDNASAKLQPILAYSPEVVMGQNVSVEECAHYIDSSFCYRVISFAHCKFCAYSFWPRESEYLFGVDTVFTSKACIHCYNSVNLTRCFEVSHSSSSSDCFFCHNVENCEDCMFCFNTKAKRYAIGNVEYQKEEYLRIKKMVLTEISAKLEKDRKLELSIFNVGCKK